MAEEFQKRDIFALSEAKLKSHITEISVYRLSRSDWPPITANECNHLLMLAHGELQNKSSSRLAKIAIGIAITSVLISTVPLLMAFL